MGVELSVNPPSRSLKKRIHKAGLSDIFDMDMSCTPSMDGTFGAVTPALTIDTPAPPDDQPPNT